MSAQTKRARKAKSGDGLAHTASLRDPFLWAIKERDEDVVVVHNVTCRQATETLVWFDRAATNWVCETCGPQQTGKTATQACIHLGVATRGLPLEVASKMAACFKPSGKAAPLTNGKSKTGDEYSADEANAARLQRSAEARARVAAEHDASHAERVGSSEVVVRQATPEDLERLRLARERKRRTYETPAGWARFASQ